MNRQQKENLVQDLGVMFGSHEASFVINYQGLTVTQMQELRLALSEKDCSIKVAKNRLVKKALQTCKQDCALLSDKFSGQTAVVFVKSDITGAAKILHNFAKSNEEMSIVAGCYASQIFDQKAVAVLATLPSREVLLAQVCGTMKAPITSFVVVLKQLLVKLVLVMKAVEEKKQSNA